MKIYTKTGDKGKKRNTLLLCMISSDQAQLTRNGIGTSSLYNGERRNKDDEIFEALGQLSGDVLCI